MAKAVSICAALAGAWAAGLATGCGPEFEAREPPVDACRALSFDGDSFVEVEPSSDFDELQQWTIEAFVKPTTLDTERHIVSHHEWDPHAGYVLMVMPLDATRATFQFRYHPGGAYIAIGAEIPEADRWYHVAVTYDGASLVMLLDGTTVDAHQLASAVASAPSELVRIGAASYTDGFFFQGSVDEVRISSTARVVTPPAAPFEPDAQTVALWHFDEAEGQLAEDATGKHPGSLGADPSPAADDPERVAADCLAAMAAQGGR